MSRLSPSNHEYLVILDNDIELLQGLVAADDNTDFFESE